MLVVARFIQGIGGALTSAVILGMIVTMFPERGEQAKAIGVYSFVASAGGSIGLLAGGAITQAINWHWIFIVNLPIALVTGALSLRFLSRDRGLGFSQGADLPGATFIVTAVMMGVYAIVEATNYGWARPTRSASAPARSPFWSPSWSASRVPRTRWSHCGSSARGTSPGPTRSRR